MKITIATHDLEVEKPSGGGKGQKVLYFTEVLLDGEIALHLHAYHFKKPGQLAAFTEAMERLLHK